MTWGRVRRHYGAILLRDPLPRDAIAAEIEIQYWNWVVERREKISWASGMSYFHGWLNGRSQGLQEARIRAGGDQWMANWKRGRLLNFLFKNLEAAQKTWVSNSRTAFLLRESTNTLSNGHLNGRIVGLKRAIQLLLGKNWKYHSPEKFKHSLSYLNKINPEQLNSINNNLFKPSKSIKQTKAYTKKPLQIDFFS